MLPGSAFAPVLASDARQIDFGKPDLAPRSSSSHPPGLQSPAWRALQELRANPPSCAIAMPRSASAGGSSRSAKV
jgi:hypothetical protein